MIKTWTTLTGILAAACLLAVGCQPGAVQDGGKMCPGKGSIAESVAILSLQRQNAQPLQAGADCVFHYTDDNGKPQSKEVKAVAVRFVPPDRVLFRGSVFGDVVGFGANEDEFWLRVKPDLDSYWWGTREQAEKCSERILINPYNVIEALGKVDVNANWQLSYSNGDDILTLEKDDGTLVKRVFINACDYLVERIEYFDSEGLLKAAADLSDYTAGEQGLNVPSAIEVTQYQYGIPEGSVEIELKHIRPFVPQAKHKRLFQRPEREGFEHMYQLNEQCEFIEQ